MRSASFQTESDRPRASLRRRAGSFLLALAAELLIVLGLITLAWREPTPPKPKPEPNTFSLMPSTKEKAATKKASHSNAHSKSAAPKTAPPAPIVPPILSKPAPNPMLNDKELFDAADISKMHGDAGDTGDSKAAYGPGEGPGGERLFIAALDDRGIGLAQTATAAMGGRKFFYFGTAPGGRHWMDYLTLPGEGDYIELQSGIAPGPAPGNV